MKNKNVFLTYLTISLIGCATVGSAASNIKPSGGSCRIDLSYLESTIPNFIAPELSTIRENFFALNVYTDMKEAKELGVTPEQYISQTLADARTFDQSAKEASETASAVDAYGITDEQFLEQIKSGDLNVPKCDGIRNAALCAATGFKLGAIGMRAIAAELQCHLRAGTWRR